ncbi:MAG: hypothetical protein M9894_29250 [Planctomycetes bacterium]|nr:hypothetical protein [Planctomycetota bacterium]
MSALAAVRALLERLQSGEALSEAELDALALEARALRRRLERLRAAAPEVEVELDPTLARLAERAAPALPV